MLVHNTIAILIYQRVQEVEEESNPCVKDIKTSEAEA